MPAEISVLFGMLCRPAESVKDGHVAFHPVQSIPAISAMLQGLLAVAAPGVDPQALLKADVSAIPKTLPVLSLAFVFHNIIPVIATSLEVG